ncbi:MAG TPA: 2'-5' RNA ligase family protein, partial [Micromonosporaceae bacterium]
VPHLSYAVMLHWGLDAVRAAVAALPDGGEVTMVLDAVGAFRRGRVGLIPAVPEDLVRRQQTVVEAVQATGAEVHRHYRAGRWLPHCSVAPRTRLDQLPVAAASLYEVIPLTVRLDHAALIDSSTGARWPLPHLP